LWEEIGHREPERSDDVLGGATHEAMHKHPAVVSGTDGQAPAAAVIVRRAESRPPLRVFLEALQFLQNALHGIIYTRHHHEPSGMRCPEVAQPP